MKNFSIYSRWLDVIWVNQCKICRTTLTPGRKALWRASALSEGMFLVLMDVTSSLPAASASALSGEELPLLEPRQADRQHPGNSCCLEKSLRSVVTYVPPNFISILSSYPSSLAEWLVPRLYGTWSSIRKGGLSPMLVVIPVLKELSGISWCEEHFCEKFSLQFRPWPKSLPASSFGILVLTSLLLVLNTRT